MPKPRSRLKPDAEALAAFVDSADAPVAPKKDAKIKAINQKKVLTARTTISLPKPILDELESLAFNNKRKGLVLDSVSAIAREAILEYLDK